MSEVSHPGNLTVAVLHGDSYENAVSDHILLPENQSFCESAGKILHSFFHLFVTSTQHLRVITNRGVWKKSIFCKRFKHFHRKSWCWLSGRIFSFWSDVSGLKLCCLMILNWILLGFCLLHLWNWEVFIYLIKSKTIFYGKRLTFLKENTLWWQYQNFISSALKFQRINCCLLHWKRV